MSEPPTIFIHVQKTGGTSLRTILRHEYDVLHGKNRLYSTEEIESYFDEPFTEAGHKKAIVGHMAFGAHRCIDGTARYITMLRDPISRVISYYYYLIERGNESDDYIEKNDLGVAEYVRDGLLWHGIQHTNNLQTRLLSGKGKTVNFGECTTEMLDRAKQNIEEHFSVVGLTEEFDESILLMRRKLGWDLPVYWYQNKTTSRPRKEDHSDETIDVIREYNGLDLELYAFCKERFREQVSSTDLSMDRRLLRIGNAIYGPATNLYVQLRKMRNWLVGREKW
jgi:hypothetical protein